MAPATDGEAHIAHAERRLPASTTTTTSKRDAPLAKQPFVESASSANARRAPASTRSLGYKVLEDKMMEQNEQRWRLYLAQQHAEALSTAASDTDDRSSRPSVSVAGATDSHVADTSSTDPESSTSSPLYLDQMASRPHSAASRVDDFPRSRDVTDADDPESSRRRWWAEWSRQRPQWSTSSSGRAPTTMAERLSAGKSANVEADRLRYRIEHQLQSERPTLYYTSPSPVESSMPAGNGVGSSRNWGGKDDGLRYGSGSGDGAGVGLGSGNVGDRQRGAHEDATVTRHAGVDSDQDEDQWSAVASRLRSALGSGSHDDGEAARASWPAPKGQTIPRASLRRVRKDAPDLSSAASDAHAASSSLGSRGSSRVAAPEAGRGLAARHRNHALTGGIDPPPYGGRPVPDPTDETIALLLPLLVLLSTLLFLLLLFIILVILVRRRARIALSDGDGPVDVGREEELEGMGGLDGVEERWLETQDEPTRRGYQRAKAWVTAYPPASQSTDITMSQFLSIQEKGVSAWSFDPDYESNPSVFVEARTEITFLADGQGMAPQEGGGCSVQSNLPLPKINDVYYWEAKMFSKPENTNVAVGLATKPYPSFRLPGLCKFSVGYFSSDGFKCHNYPFAAQSYGPAFLQGDVIGVGYRPRTGTVFFTRNGKKLEDAFVGLNRHNLFPTVGADGSAEVHVNLGQAGFVFIEANVKKWGLAPMVGTLAPPPAYGMERGSILIEAAGQGTSSAATAAGTGARVGTLIPGDVTPPPPPTPPSNDASPPLGAAGATSSADSALSRRRRGRRSVGTSAPSSRLSAVSETGAAGEGRRRGSSGRSGEGGGSSSESDAEDPSPSPRRVSESSADAPHNPPTPNALDISLHALPPHQLPASGAVSGNGSRQGLLAGYFAGVTTTGRRGGSSGGGSTTERVRSPSPPPYTVAGAASASSSSSSPFDSVRRVSGQTHAAASRVLTFLTERGLLASISPQPPPPSSSSANPSASTASSTHGVSAEYEGRMARRDGEAVAAAAAAAAASATRRSSASAPRRDGATVRNSTSSSSSSSSAASANRRTTSNGAQRPEDASSWLAAWFR